MWKMKKEKKREREYLWGGEGGDERYGCDGGGQILILCVLRLGESRKDDGQNPTHLAAAPTSSPPPPINK